MSAVERRLCRWVFLFNLVAAGAVVVCFILAAALTGDCGVTGKPVCGDLIDWRALGLILVGIGCCEGVLLVLSFASDNE